MQISFRNWTFEADSEKTRLICEAITARGGNRFDNSYDNNFYAYWPDVYPTEVRELFHQVGVDPIIETEISQVYRDESGWHHYLCWLHFVGQVLSGPLGDHTPKKGLDLQPITDQFSIAFTHSRDLIAADFDGLPVVQVHFYVLLRWQIDVPDPEDHPIPDIPPVGGTPLNFLRRLWLRWGQRRITRPTE